jgi:antitoxin component YwqK of YwqJK toxin-antitoxin module
MYFLTLSPLPETKYIYCNGQQKYQIITYQYRRGNIKKEEIYKKSGHFDWKKDSLWIYYNKKGKIIKKEKYENDSLIYIYPLNLK